MSGAGSVLFDRLVDDAGLFPPERLDMAAAVRRHQAARLDASPVLTHRFVAPAEQLPLVLQALPSGAAITVSAITGLTEGPLTSLANTSDGLRPRLVLSSLEGVLPEPEQSFAAPSRELTAVLPYVFAEVPIDRDPRPALERVAQAGFAAKLRCGGVRAELFPSVGDLARAVRACVSLGLPFKATAGLHHAVRYVDRRTGFQHHGFLNLLLATKRAVEGHGVDDVADVLRSTDADALVGEVASVSRDLGARTRAQWVSYGCCTPADPIGDLLRLGLIRRTGPSSPAAPLDPPERDQS